MVSVPEVRILHLPSVRFDAVDRPLLDVPLRRSTLYWGMGSSIADLDRAEPNLHARNVGRLDIYPHVEWPLHLGNWQVRPEFALRLTQYSGSQVPDLAGTNFGGVPFVQHNPLTRADLEASVDVRPPSLERDFTLGRWNRVLRHVIEPEVYYRYVTGINNARETLHFDTTDIATNTNEAGFSLTQRLYLKPILNNHCKLDAAVPDGGDLVAEQDSTDKAEETVAAKNCTAKAREWASWQIAQKYFIDPIFGGALIPDRRNVFDSTLDLTGVAFLTSPPQHLSGYLAAAL